MYATFAPYGMPCSPDWYIKKDAMATGPHIRRIQGRNFPLFPVFALSAMRPIPISVKASMNLATRNMVPIIPVLMPITLE